MQYETSKPIGVTAPKAATVFDNTASVLNAAQVIATRIECLADRLLGPIPRAGSTGSDAPCAPGALNLLADQAQQTSLRISEANDALSRIEAALP